MKIINATPPEDFPKQVIVMDREFAKRHPTKGFYLRVTTESGGVEQVDLDGELTLPGAVRCAGMRGFNPTHWMEATDGHASLLPEAIKGSN